jgi:hypothetical protein
MKRQSNNKNIYSKYDISYEDFSFKSNEKYINYKLKQNIKPLFFNFKNPFPLINYENLLNFETKKSCFSIDTTESEEDEKNQNENSSFPLLKKNFFDEENKNQQNKVQIKSYLFNF